MRPRIRLVGHCELGTRKSFISLSLRYPSLLRGNRRLHLSASPSGASPDLLSIETSNTTNVESPDAKFEVLGAPFSLLSVSLSASQNLYTRRGTLVGVSGKVENATSTLSLLEPFRRILLGIPFLYQKVSSASPITALISTKSPITSFAVVHLDGTLDWMVAQRRALLAWTGHTLSVKPTMNRHMSLAHWGNSQITGRGLLALVGKGQIYQIVLKAGEDYVAHPSNVVGYTMSQNPPLPYRLKSSILRFQIPKIGLPGILPDTKFFRVMRESGTWRAVVKVLFTLRTWSRRTIWGDRLFLHFYGPTTILLQTRASRLSDVLTAQDVNEIADSPAGTVRSAVALVSSGITRDDIDSLNPTTPPVNKPIRLNVASIGQDGKVKFEERDNFKAISN